MSPDAHRLTSDFSFRSTAMRRERRARHSLISLTKAASCLKHHFPRWLLENVQETQPSGRELPEQRMQAHSLMSGVQVKVAAPKERPLFVSGNFSKIG